MAYPPSGEPVNNPLLQAAFAYARNGWSVFPLHDTTSGRCSCNKDCGKDVGKHPRTMNGHKDATNDSQQIFEWWDMWPDSNIGIATGTSNLLVMDVDTKVYVDKDGVEQSKQGAQTISMREAENGQLPSTYTVKTSTGGWHHYFQMPAQRLGCTRGEEDNYLGADVDTRGDGGYVVAPPSVIFGRPYVLEVNAPLAPLPEWVAQKLQKPVRAPSTLPVNRHTGEILEGFQGTPPGLQRYVNKRCQEIRDEPVGGRGEPWVDGIALELSHYVPHQLQADELRAALYAAVDTWTDHPEAGRAGVDHGLRHIGTPEHETRVWEERRMRRAAPRTSDQFEDSFLAESVVADVLAGAYRYVPGVGWKAWTGRVWRDCDELEVAEEIRRWAVRQYQGALDQERREPGSVPMDVITGWRRALRAEKQITIQKMAKGFEGVFTMPEQLDRDPDKLNAQNCVVDLITGETLPHDPDLLMTKIAGADYRPGYRHPDWDKALEAVPEGVREWLQIRQGQAITGHTPPDDLLVILHGSGENGKSAEMAATVGALGLNEYCAQLSDRVLMADPSAHPTELMDLMGVRYAVMEETPEARRLDTQRLKRTVGTPQITARRIRQDSVTFTATHSMFISTNHRPEITETDHGSWRRLALVTFPYTFKKPWEALEKADDRLGDPGLRDRCKSDPDIHAAALAWLVEGAQRWYAADKVMPQLPERVKADTLKWRKESDTVLAFSDDALIFESGHHIHGRDFKEELDAYLIGKGMSTWSEKTIVARFESHDVMRRHGAEFKAVRANPSRSRSPRQQRITDANPYAEIPGGATYKAWKGVRFRTVADDMNEWAEATEQDHVHDVHASLETSREEISYGVNQRSVNIVNTPGRSHEIPTEEPAPHARAHAREPRPGRPFVPPGGSTPPAA
ncbi:phage/plasmid primase, P4 family [Streptomyces sp. HUAS ZL42]|uniref:phage/plasmid primase, P4 family n=1 Tax=Streptomyces sp. HUAS ZL42 TaxID=3231715 RepID=UPI00345E3405